MGRFVTIVRWTPEQWPELARRTTALNDGTAPPSAIAANAKMKIVANAYSPNNNFSILIYDVDEKDYAEASLAAIYVIDTCKMETYPVMTPEETEKLTELMAKMTAGQ
jgi:hypothetical protein